MSLDVGTNYSRAIKAIYGSYYIFFSFYVLIVTCWVLIHPAPFSQLIGIEKFSVETILLDLAVLVGIPGVLITWLHFKQTNRKLLYGKEKFLGHFGESDLRVGNMNPNLIYLVEDRDEETQKLLVKPIWQDDYVVLNKPTQKASEELLEKLDIHRFLSSMS